MVPESPRWLAANDLREKARHVLERIGGDAYAAHAMNEIEATLSDDTEQADFRALLEPKMARVLLLGVGLAILQQWCGINVIFNYAEEVFSAAGYELSNILFNIVVTGAVNLVFTLVAISTVDKLGRRVLMLAGSSGLAIIYTVLGAFYYVHSHGMHMLALVIAAIVSTPCH